jgi:hypothetical protein
MTGSQPKNLLGEHAHDASTDESEPRAIWRSSRFSKRLRVVSGAALLIGATAALIVAIGTAMSGPSKTDPAGDAAPAATAPASRVLAGAVSDTVPAPGDEDKLPWQDTSLSRTVDWPPRDSPDLRVSPATGAAALLTDVSTGSIYLLTSSGEFRMIDVQLAPTSDADSNERWPSGSISLDRSLLAFPQRDEVVVINVTSGQVVRHPLPGPNEIALWLPDNTLLVEQEATNYLLNLDDGVANRQPYQGFHGVAGQGDDIVRIADGASPAIATWDDTGQSIAMQNLDLDSITSPDEWVSGILDSYGWRNGDLVARTVFADTGAFPSGEADITAVLDVETGDIVRTLVIPWGDSEADKIRCGPGGCPVRGWLDADTVIIETSIADDHGANSHRLLGWDIRTGALSRIMDLPISASITLGPLGD